MGNRSQMITRLIFIVFVLAISSCHYDNFYAPNNLFAEWRWESTWTQTAEKLGSTYYWKFQNNGVLQIKDTNREIKSQVGFKIISIKQFSGSFIMTRPNLDDSHYGYCIKGDTLHLLNSDGVIATPSVFVLAK